MTDYLLIHKHVNRRTQSINIKSTISAPNNWCKENLLKLNVETTKVILFYFYFIPYSHHSQNRITKLREGIISTIMEELFLLLLLFFI